MATTPPWRPRKNTRPPHPCDLLNGLLSESIEESCALRRRGAERPMGKRVAAPRQLRLLARAARVRVYISASCGSWTCSLKQTPGPAARSGSSVLPPRGSRCWSVAVVRAGLLPRAYPPRWKFGGLHVRCCAMPLIHGTEIGDCRPPFAFLHLAPLVEAGAVLRVLNWR